MWKKVLALMTLTAFSYAIVMPATASAKEHEIRGYLALGGISLDLDDLNSRLSDKGYTEFSEGLFSIGGGVFHQMTPQFLIGGEGQFHVGQQTTSDIGTDTYAASIMGGYGMINTGYLVYTSDALDIFPVLGIGVGGTAVKIGQSSFDALLDNPQGAANMGSMNMLLNLALQADYKVKIPGSEAKGGFFSIGIRGGYLLSVFTSGWYMDEFSLSDDPDGVAGGPYFRINIGGGGTIK